MDTTSVTGSTVVPAILTAYGSNPWRTVHPPAGIGFWS